MKKVIGIGDNVCDIYLHQQRMYPGGQSLNFSVYCKRAGFSAAYMGVFGSDAVAAHVRKTLSELQIDTSHCREAAGENGYAIVDLVDGDRVFVRSNKGGVLRLNPLVLSEEDQRYLSGFDLIHTSNNSFFDSQLAWLKDLPALVSYDFSGSWADEDRAKAICPFIDFAFLSCSGLEEVAVREVLRRMHSWGAEIVVATRGGEDSLLYDGANYYTQSPSLVEPVDTLGAGDSFAAGFLMHYIANPDMEEHTRIQESLKNGSALAAATCTVHGAFGCAAPIQ